MQSAVPLSDRLKKVASFVSSGMRVADIGCDHAYTSIYLVQMGMAQSVISMDVNKGPLKRATENIIKFHCEDRITTRLSDGARLLQPGEADTVLISGMGGALTVKILEDSRVVINQMKELILQPQSEIHLVRKYLHETGFKITREEMVKDEGKYYFIMKAEKGKDVKYSEIDYLYGHLLLENHDVILEEFLLKERKRCKNIVESLKGEKTKKSQERLQEVEQVIDEMEEALLIINNEK